MDARDARSPTSGREADLKIGFFGINVGVAGDVDNMITIAKAAEDASLESVWTGEHVVLPDPQAPPSPSHPQTPFLDPIVALGHIAAHTTRIGLGTGIIILPQRNPVVLAKELTTLDVVSKGRLIFGIGAGYLEPEFRAIGAPYEDRGAATDEWIEVLMALWTMPNPKYSGKYFSFDGIDAQPRPVQKPHPPIVVGGMTKLATKRAARYGNGWYGFATDVERTARCIGWINEYVEKGMRPGELGPLEISVTPPFRLDADGVKQYEDIGVHRLMPASGATTVEDAVHLVDKLGALVS
jgi:probable F420-dependent oxidoreductase